MLHTGNVFQKNLTKLGNRSNNICYKIWNKQIPLGDTQAWEADTVE